MEFKLYSVKDTCAGTFSAPVTFNNDALALRWFDKFVKDTGFQPSDFQLWYLGFYSSETGKLSEDLTFLKTGVTSNA